MKKETQDFNTLVNSLSNWERNQWARAGYPGLRKKEVNKLIPFLATRKREPAVA